MPPVLECGSLWAVGWRETSSAGSLLQSLGDARAHSVLAALACPAHPQGTSWAPGRFDRIQVIFVTPEHNLRFLSYLLPYPLASDF